MLGNGAEDIRESYAGELWIEGISREIITYPEIENVAGAFVGNRDVLRATVRRIEAMLTTESEKTKTQFCHNLNMDKYSSILDLSVFNLCLIRGLLVFSVV